LQGRGIRRGGGPSMALLAEIGGQHFLRGA
jgi:hypothetical protein